MSSFRDLQVWQMSVDFTTSIYRLTKKFPPTERFALTDQIHRASVSIPSNIAEGAQRQSKKDFINFLHISYGSCAEVETQLTIASKLGYLTNADFESVMKRLLNIEKMLNGLIRSLKIVATNDKQQKTNN